MFARSQGLKVLDERYHRKAQDAKEQTRSLDDWSPQDIQRWDLDEPHRKPTGRENPRTWTYSKPLRDQNRSKRNTQADARRDARKNPRIRDAPEEGEA